MKIRLMIGIILLCLVPLHAQNLGNLGFINELGDREAATFGDAVAFFVLMENKSPGSFEANLRALQQSGLADGIRLGEQALLDKGTLSLMVARYLDIKDNLLYLISRAGRYAFRACVEEGLMDAEAGEWDLVSGEELIETMAKVSAKKEAAR